MISMSELEHYRDLEQAKGNLLPDPDSEEFWMWLNSSGISKYPSLKKHLSPFPAENLRVIVSGMADENEFACSGSNIYGSLTKILSAHGKNWSQFPRILDFACGCGRVTRLLLKHSDRCSVVGSDVNEVHIRWLNENMPFGKYFVNGSLPPTSFNSKFFSLVFCVSLFSHFNEVHQFSWLQELARIADRDAMLILTVHGRHAFRVLTDRPDIRTRMGLTANQLNFAGTELDDGGFSFVRQEDSYIDKDSYGFTFISEEYVKRAWSQYFNVVEVRSGAIEDWQDAVVLRPLRE